MKAGPLELSSSQLCPHGVGVACYPSSFGSRALCRLSRPQHLHSCWQTASLDGFSTLVGYFPGGSEGQESACSAGDVGSIPGSGRSPGEGHGNPLQYFSLENPRDRGAWRATVHGVAKSRTRLSDQGAGEGTSGPCCLSEKIHRE